ncbi:hypothetical protein EP073_03575 [Geovibrio thiophilus]|uniref:Uncharacterized protein n=1 Tax=Geovibrio thiophilus TaxID=139438 RepID=A0A3R5XW33_9BACT|nr:hypothetical protein [Geovibrio thiophilus]QAR32514.1 hypothetical protein EP073_03575 [Geovibrio thiophilus]
MIIKFENPVGGLYQTGAFSESTPAGGNAERKADSDTVQISSAAAKLGKILEDLRSAKSVQEAQDIKNTLMLEKSTGLYKLIMPDSASISELASALAENGKSIPKPDETTNDVQWGSMVRLGETVGIDDGEVLASLTAEDLNLFFNEFVEKEGITDPAIKQFTDTDSFWKAVFKTDEEGNFLKENGKAVRNTDFEFVMISKPQPNIKITSDYDISSIYGNASFTRDQNYDTDLTALSPETILRWDDAIRYRNPNMKGMALGDSSSGAKGVWNAGEDEAAYFKREPGFYMLQSKTNFNSYFRKTAETGYTTEKFTYS